MAYGADAYTDPRMGNDKDKKKKKGNNKQREMAITRRLKITTKNTGNDEKDKDLVKKRKKVGY